MKRADWVSLIPNGIGQIKPNHYLEMARVLWRNRDELPYAWRILSRGVCDGCALGTSGMRDFTIKGGYRYSDYSTGATTDTYKIEAELAPTADIRVRGGYNRAVRAPTVQDLFAPQRVALDGSTDPCAGFATRNCRRNHQPNADETPRTHSSIG